MMKLSEQLKDLQDQGVYEENMPWDELILQAEALETDYEEINSVENIQNLRDKMAMASFNIFMSTTINKYHVNDIANLAFRIADAMLLERSKK